MSNFNFVLKASVQAPFCSFSKRISSIMIEELYTDLNKRRLIDYYPSFNVIYFVLVNIVVCRKDMHRCIRLIMPFVNAG